MICYGGVYLPVASRQISQWIEANIPPSSAYMFTYPDWPGPSRENWPAPGRTDDRKVALGTLYWPNNAQQWAVYYGLVCDDDLDTLRPLAYPDDTLTPLELRLDDGMVTDGAGNALVSLYEASGIKTNLYMLPPMPLAQCSPHLDTDRMLYLITLVDERYFWWYKSVDITINAGTTTWEDLITSVETALGITIEHTTIESEWLKPSDDLTTRYESIPLLLDAIASCTGRQVVRSRDGTVTLQKPLEAKTVQDAQLRDWPRQAGGLYHFSPDTALTAGNDLHGLAPRQVDVIFSEAKNGTATGNPYKVSVTLASLALSQYGSSLGFTGERVFHTACVANFLGSSTVPDNNAEVNTLAQAIARDYYLWRLGRQDQVYAGIANYDPEGLSEVIEWSITDMEVNTRVRRGVWDDRIVDLLHHGTYGGVPGPIIPGISSNGVITLTKNVVIEPTEPCSGPILSVKPPTDHPDTIFEIDKVPTGPFTSGPQPPKEPPIFTVINEGIIVQPPIGAVGTPAIAITYESGYTSNPIEVGKSGFDPVFGVGPGGTTVIKPELPTDPGLIISTPPDYTAFPIYVEDAATQDKYFTVNASGRIGSGSVDTDTLVDGSVTSGKLASGLLTSFALTSGIITSGYLGEGVVNSGNLASGLIQGIADSVVITTIGTNAFPAGELLSGVRCVRLDAATTSLMNAFALSGKIPAIGITTGEYASGTLNVPVITMGKISVASGLDISWSGIKGRALYVGTDGSVTSGGGSPIAFQRIGVGFSGGLYVFMHYANSDS